MQIIVIFHNCPEQEEEEEQQQQSDPKDLGSKFLRSKRNQIIGEIGLIGRLSLM